VIPTRALGTACVLLAVATVGGCATDDGGGAGEGDRLTVYVSVPLQGPSGAFGGAIRDGARLALEDAGGKAGDVEIDLVFLDDTQGGRWRPGVVGENARAASSDSTAIAYIGELESGATRTSLPITNEARMLQVSPASTAVDLVSPFPGSDDVPDQVQPSGERSFGRVIPDDEAQAAAGAEWAGRLGVRTALVVSDGSEFGDTVAEEFAEEAEVLGVSVDRAGGEAAALRGARANPDLIYYGGVGGAAMPFLDRAVRSSDAMIMGTDALLLDPSFLRLARPFEPRLRLTASAQGPSQLPPPEGPEFVSGYRHQFGHGADPYTAYGYEAIAVVLDSIERAGDTVDRTAVIDAFLDTTDRSSVLGTYSIDEVGDTTLDRLAGYRVRDGRPVFDSALRVP
jgi:branched-chain amino acid transport system substrate-binding protein